MMKTIVIYGVLVNVVAFLMMGRDKRAAVMGKQRIPEKSLMAIAMIGGSLGAYAGMRQFHHKTKKRKFSFGIPAIIVLQVGVIAYLILQ